MADIPLPGRDSVEAQRELFRRASTEHGLTLAVIAKRSPLKLSTLKGWSTGSAMPAWALFQLGEAGVPDDLLSLVAKPFDRHVSTNSAEDDDLDALAQAAGEFFLAWSNARNSRSPGGPAVVPQEKAGLTPLKENLQALARRVG